MISLFVYLFRKKLAHPRYAVMLVSALYLDINILFAITVICIGNRG
jgi:hypothetical protein